MFARFDGVSVCVSRPALTARPAGKPCEVENQNRMSFSVSNPLAATCSDLASASIVAPPPFFELYCTSIGPLPKRPATTCCCAGRLASEHALIAEKTKGHHAHLASILDGVHRRDRRRDRQNKSDERCAEPPDPRLRGHGETSLRDHRHSIAAQNGNCGTMASFHSCGRHLRWLTFLGGATES